MLHILLLILKIIGIVLAVILGLVLLIISVVLFAAIRYEVRAATDGDIKNLDLNLKFSWLFHLISGYVTYQKQNLDWQVKLAWKKLNVPKEEEKPTSVTVIDEPEVHQEQVAEPKVEVKPQAKPDTKQSQEPSKKPSPKTKKESEKKSKKKSENKAEKKRFLDKLKEIKAQKDKILAFIKAEKHKLAFQRVLKEGLRLLKKLKPRKLKANTEFGFEDPYTTGSVLAYASMLYPFYGDNISIRPNFEEAILKGDVYVKGHIRISYFVSMGLRLLLDKNIRLTIKDAKKLIAKK